MSSHMAGGCPPRSAVASGPLKCELNFSAGSCAFGLFVTRRFGVRGVGARLRPWCYAPLGPLAGANRERALGCNAAQQGSHEQQAVWLLRSAWPQQTTDNRPQVVPQASTSKGAASSKRKSTPQCHTQRAASALNIKAASQGGPRINHPPRSLHWAYTATPGGDHLHSCQEHGR